MELTKKWHLLLKLFILTPGVIVAASAFSEPPPGPPPGQPGGAGPGATNSQVSRVSVTEGDWSFDLVTKISGSSKTVSSTVTYYAGKAKKVVLVPSVLGGANVTKIASQAFGHHGEIAALYLPDTVVEISDWAFYDLNEAVIISCANPEVSINDAAFQSSGNAQLYLPPSTTQKVAGGKPVETNDTRLLSVKIEQASAAAIAGGSYLNVTSPSGYGVTTADITGIARSASNSVSDVNIQGNTVVFSGSTYVAQKQKIEIFEKFQSDIKADELDKRFRSLTKSAAASLNASIAKDDSYSTVKTLLTFEPGYYLNGNSVKLDAEVVAYDVQTGTQVSADNTTGLLPSTGSGYYKYVTYRDSDNDGDIDALYYSPYSLSYSYKPTQIASSNKYLNGLSARDVLNPIYLSFANSVLTAKGGTDIQYSDALSVQTATDGKVLEANINQERSILWASDYGSITVDKLHAISSSVGNWAKMSYEAGLDTYNPEIIMEWGMNALLYATNGGKIQVGSLEGPTSTLYATGDGANGIIAGGSGREAGEEGATHSTAIVSLYNAKVALEGWNNHVADVVYGGYAYLERVDSTTGVLGSYAVGQASALANDFGNGVVEAKDFHTTVFGNRSAGAYVIGGGVITAEDSSFTSKMDAGLVSASGGTFVVKDSSVTGVMAFRNRGGINNDSVSTFDNVDFIADEDNSSYTVGDTAEQAVAAWKQASGDVQLIHYMMSDPKMTLGQLCKNYGISEDNQLMLLSTLSKLAGVTYSTNTLLRNSLLDNSYYNYSAGRYTGKTDFAEIPYLTTGSSFGGLVRSVFEFEASGITLNLNKSSFINTNKTDYQYLVASEAGSNPVVRFNYSDASGLIWNEGNVRRSVEGRVAERSSGITVAFSSSDFTGSFADGPNGLWVVKGANYINGLGENTSINGNYYGASANWGINASFDSGSSWVVERDSYLGALTIAKGAKVQAPDGYSIRMTVNGEEATIKSGSYSGEIVISVNKIAKH